MENPDRQRPPRLTLATFFHDAADELLSADRGLPYTFATLFRAPARVVHEYIDWRSARVTKPLRYLLIVILMVNLAASVTEWVVAKPSARLAPAGTVVAAGAEPMTKDQQTAARHTETILSLAGNHIDWVLLLAVPFLALAFRRCFAAQGYNFAEFWVLALYATAQAYAVIVFGSLLLQLCAGPSAAALALALAPPTIAWICADVITGTRWRNFAIGLVSFALALFLLTLTLIAAEFIALALSRG